MRDGSTSAHAFGAAVVARSVEMVTQALKGMVPTAPPSRARPSRASASDSAVYGRRLCLCGAIIGAVGLLGWLSGLVQLARMVPGQPPMMPNTALCAVLLGAAGAVRRKDASPEVRTLTVVAVVVVLAIASVTLVQYVLGVDFGVDALIVDVRIDSRRARMSPPSAVALLFLALAYLMSPDAHVRARVRVSEWLVVAAGLIALTIVLGQLFGGWPIRWTEGKPGAVVAIPTALSLFSISLGLLLQQTGGVIMSVAASPGPGGILVRRLALAAVLGPALLGLVLVQMLAVLGIEDLPIVFACLVSVSMLAGLSLLLITAVPMNRIHDALEASRARTDALIEQASEGVLVADAVGRYTDVNSAACRILGYEAEEIRGKTKADLLAPSELDRLARHKEMLFRGETLLSEWTFRRKDGTTFPAEVSSRILPDGRWQSFIRDVSERKRAQDSLRESMERFELALRGADLAAWDWNMSTNEVVFNPRWAEMRGLRLDEVPPNVDSWRAGVHPDDLPMVEKALADHLAGVTPEYETEHRVRARCGDWIWIFVRGKIFAWDEAGRPIRMVGTELEVTARKRIEEALRLSEAKFSGILAISADAVVSVDDDQRITMFNAAAESMFGYSRSEVIGESLEILIPERFRAIHREHMKAFAAGPSVSRQVGAQAVFGVRKTGEEFRAETAISKLDVGGTRVFTATLRDVTEKLRREGEKELLSEVGSALTSSLDYTVTARWVAEVLVRDFADLCIVDLVGEQHELRRLAVTARDASKQWACDVLMQIPPDRRHLELSNVPLDTRGPVLLERGSAETIAALARSEAHHRAIEAFEPGFVISVPLMLHDELVGMLVLASSSSRAFDPRTLQLAVEIAERITLWLDSVRHYLAAQQAIRARDEVLGIVAHDLRNPLGAILLQAALLQRMFEAQGMSRKPADVIERAANRMNHLIQDLLDVMRLDGHRLTFEKDRLSPRQIVADVVETQRPLVSAASLELDVDVADDLPDVWADRDRLLQVFDNLVSNAVKFTKPGGRVTLGALAQEHAVQFWVADTGIGIDPEDVPHLFDRYWQASTAERARGAGLGLSIVRGIVEAHGGRVGVTSTPGRGSTFFFTIPKASAAGPRPSGAPDDESSGPS